MGKIGPNEPCPCGSGKKYKKCCMSKSSDELSKPTFLASNLTQGCLEDFNALDSLSNSVPDLIAEGQIDKAEEACKKLLQDYPDQHDGLHRYAEVYAARGNKDKAIEYYKKTIEYMKTHDGFDSDSIAWVQEEINKLEGK